MYRLGLQFCDDDLPIFNFETRDAHRDAANSAMRHRRERLVSRQAFRS